MSQNNWKNTAIDKSVGVSDAWDVFISWAGRFAAWILFGCMVLNIIEVVVSLPSALVNAVMITQVITLDVAGFALNTIAKQVYKKGDDEQKKIATKAMRLASFLISLMILTLALVTVGYLIPAWATYTDDVNKGLILVRVIMIVLYMHTMHDLSEAAGEIKQKAVQTQQANDQLALENKQQIEASDKKIDTVYVRIEKLEEVCTRQEKHIQKLEDHIQKLEGHIQNTETTIDTTIDNRINELSTSVTEIHNNVLQITQNNQYNVPAYPLARDEQNGYSVEEVSASPAMIEQPKTLAIPALEVAGMAPEKVVEVLTFVLSGSSWTRASKDLNLNYSRVIKPIRDAYEKSLESSVHTL